MISNDKTGLSCLYCFASLGLQAVEQNKPKQSYLNIILIGISIKQANIALARKILHESERELQFQLFGGHYSKYFYNIGRIRVLLPDYIKYTDLLIGQIA